MRRRSGQDLAFRQSMLPDALHRTPAPDPPGAPSGPTPETVWQYWHAGVRDAPAVVRCCLDSVRRHADGRTVAVLDDESLSAHVQLPAHVVERRAEIGPTHFSDVVRFALLAAYGGTWIDATVLLSEPVPDEAAQAPFFAVSRPEDPLVISTWFIRAVPEHPLIIVLRDMLYDYWRREPQLGHYFLTHFMFEAAVVVHGPLRRLWLESPYADIAPTHRLQWLLDEPFDPARFDEVLAGSWVHKLTWKSPPTARRGTAPTYLDHLLDRAGPT
jgi:hypothetical protein